MAGRGASLFLYNDVVLCILSIIASGFLHVELKTEVPRFSVYRIKNKLKEPGAEVTLFIAMFVLPLIIIISLSSTY